jgi:NADH-quinone oxidoreductase E subunit
MAWITKNSAGQTIERRDEPYLTDAMKQKLTDDVLPRFVTKQAALLPALHEVQHHHGWIPPQALEEIGQFLELSAAEVLDTATFYDEYYLHPKGRHLVQICQSISCELCGQRELLERVQDKLGIEPGETTEDGRYTLVCLECIGACGGAPAALLNETLHENLTWEQLEAELDKLE